MVNRMFDIHIPNITPFKRYGYFYTSTAVREIGPKYFTNRDGGEWQRINPTLYKLIMGAPEKYWYLTGIHSLAFGEPATGQYARWDVINGWTDSPATCFY